MRSIRVDNYIVEEPLINIVQRLKLTLTNGKLSEVIDKGDELVVTCPSDDHSNGCEQRASMHITLRDDLDIPYGTVHCFSCGVSGSFIKFVALCFSTSEAYAKKWLIQNYGILAYTSVPMGDFIKLPTNNVKSARKIDEAILDTYQSWCPYLAKRKLSREACEGLKIKYDTYNRQVVFPIYDINDNLVMLARRSIDTKFFHMDKDVDKPVYGLNIIKKNNITTCMIVEGLFDLATCYTHGIPAIATLGAVSDEQVELINNSGIRSLYLAFDNDSAGKKFKAYLEARLKPTIITTNIQLPAGRKDVNDLTAEEWDNLIKKYF